MVSNIDLGVDIKYSGTYYLTGTTYSSDFPTTPWVYDSTYGGYGDAFVISLSVDGQTLNYSSYLGGIYTEDKAYGIDVSSGCAYIVGETYQPVGFADFPTINAYDASYNGGHDVFLTKFASDGRSLLFSTYMGGANHDYGYDVVLCGDNILLTGKTNSSNFPHTAGMIHGGYDAFYAKLTNTGDSLIYSVFFGGSGDDFANCIDFCRTCSYPICSPVIAGQTFSNDFPVWTSSLDSTYGGNGDGFIMHPYFTAYFGGESEDNIFDIISGKPVRIIGSTSSSDFPVKYAYDYNLNGGSDIFLTTVDAWNEEILRSTLLGGSGNDFGYGIAGYGDKIYIAGQTNSSNFPIRESYDSTYNNSGDGFYAMFDFSVCCIGIRGNADYDPYDDINVSDVTYLVDFLFRGGTAPICFEEADIDSDDNILVNDIVWLVNYLFKGGIEPYSCPN